MHVKGYMNEATWDGTELRAKGTNKMAHFALIGPADVDPDDYITKEESEEKGAGETWKQGAKASAALFKTPDELVLTREDMASVEFKRATRLTNGRIRIRTHAGGDHQLHFRRKSNEEFEALAKELGATGL